MLGKIHTRKFIEILVFGFRAWIIPKNTPKDYRVCENNQVYLKYLL
ncbi:hypothetical protein HFN_2359 [Helicobacter fennelliae MRY12-0050]|uniref:Uncharacterized protein n=1 Tax=Helicobacter fennelliae MRY12-0050 TaxID=1325130 RepID=T1CZT5_9HELI|nr:hypothetical protein HFN_2359 [Helicobacter fennelliae MRY12-0050]